MTARFVTLEGGEAVGKSTQVHALAEGLRTHGIDVVTTREPGGTANAEAVRALLMTGSADRWSARAEALLFAAARADHVERVIRPALAAGRWVLCDRYVDSSRAYQGGGGALSDEDVMALHRVGSEALMPDRTLLLRVSRDIAAARLAARGGHDRFDAKLPGYADALDARFAAIASAEPARVRVVDADGEAVVVTQRLIDALGDLL